MYDFRIIYDKSEIAQYKNENRIWQGIPSIEHTDKGRTFVCFYSGNTKETIGNYILIYYSDDQINYSEPFAIIMPMEGFRCYDCAMWIDPRNRLWLIWSQQPDKGTYAAICENPNDNLPMFGDPFYIGRDVMMNKPTVLSTGEWIFPIAVWARHDVPDYPVPSGAYAYVSNDCGKTFEPRGFAKVEKRVFDEHMFVEHKDKISVYIRTSYGITVSDSYDGGKHWIGDKKLMDGPSSRFFIRRLPSDRLLLIYHDGPGPRNNLTVFLSEDDGKTWKYKLLLDERNWVSYPDAKLDNDGYIHIVYDRDRGGFKKCLKDAESCAREILTACVKEEDIVAGKLISEKSYLKRVINKLGKYSLIDKNPYNEPELFSHVELAEHLIKNFDKEEICDSLFDKLNIPCDKAHKVNTERLDTLLNNFTENGCKDNALLAEIITEIRNAALLTTSREPIVNSVIKKIDSDLAAEFSQDSLANELGISKYYLAHLFKKETGIPLMQYINERRIIAAKRLLCESHISIAEIAGRCGFSPSYFSEQFKSKTGLSPTEYRKLHR